MREKKRVIDVYDEEYQETTIIGNRVYSTAELWNRAKDEPEIEVPIVAFSFANEPWGEIHTLYEFAYHYARCLDADMNDPILLSPNGGLIDGNHRLVRAAMEGKTTIKAKQLKRYPNPITIDKD